ncbi:MAG TPA: OB-fold domain-containing protein [Nocardioidaceae bacterium]|nr:OB-fold domain-containing protein [Nocardioidaceae bacterium]
MLPHVETPTGHGLLPVEPDPDTAPYWQALASGKLMLPHCLSCARVWSPPSATCPHCGGKDHDWIEHDGRGQVYSWTVVHRALDDAFAEDVPCAIAVVELDAADGARLVGRLLAPDNAPSPPPVAAQMPVQTVTYPLGGRALLGFLPVSDSPASAQKGVP